MKGLVRVFNTILALCVMAMVLLIFWFLISWYARGGTPGGTISYMKHTLENMFQSVGAWLTSLF